MRSQQTPNGALDEAFVKVTPDAIGESPSINCKKPEGVTDRCSFQVAKTIHPTVAGCKIRDKEAIFVTTRTFAIAKPNIDCERVASLVRTGCFLPSTTTFNIHNVPHGEGCSTEMGK